MTSNCEPFELMMADALTGRLDAVEREALQAHLRGCAECAAEYKRMQSASRLLEEAFPERSAPREAVWARVQKTLAEKPAPVATPEVSNVRAGGRWWIGAVAGLAASLAVIAAVFYFTAPPSTSVAVIPETPLPPTREVVTIAENPTPVPPSEPAPIKGPATTAIPVAPAVPKAPLAQPLPQMPDPTPAPSPSDAFVVAPPPAAEVLSPAATLSASTATSISPVETVMALPPKAVTGPAKSPATPAIAAPAVVHSDRPRRTVHDDAAGLLVLRATGPLALFDERAKAWRGVVAGERVAYGARMRTGARSRAELAFGESRVRIDELSDLAVDRAADRSRVAKLAQGKVLVDLLRSDTPFRIQSGGGSVELTGTIVEVETPESELSFVRVVEGHVKVSARHGEKIEATEARAGSEALVACGLSDERMKRLPPQLRERAEKLIARRVATEDPAAVVAKPAPKPFTLPAWAESLDKPGPLNSSSVGQLIVKDEQGRETEPLVVKLLDVQADIQGAMALTRVEQVFQNTTPRTLEGTFYFPLPPGAAISRFAMYVDEKTLIEGEVVERGHARAVFESILRTKRDPALLEWMEGNLFKCRIFPIPGNSDKRVILEYTQLLPAFYDTRRYVYPLVSELTQKHPIGRLKLRVDVDTCGAANLTGVASPAYSSATRIDGVGTPRAHAALDLRDVSPAADFVLNCSSPRGGDWQTTTYDAPNETRYLLMGYQPKEALGGGGDWANGVTEPRDILFLVETSGARTPQDLDAQTKVLEAMLAGLTPDRDRAAIAAADVGFTPFAPFSAPMETSTSAAFSAIQQRSPLGALDMGATVAGAATYMKEHARPGAQRAIIFLGSGVPALGTMDSGRLSDACAASLTDAKASFSGVGVGRTVDALLLTELARRSGGTYTPLPVDAGVEELAFLLALGLRTPRVENPVMTLTAKGADGIESRIPAMPERIGSLLPGQEIFLHARLPLDKPVTASLAAQWQSQPFAASHTIAVPRPPTPNPQPPAVQNPAVARFWARAHLDRLIAEPLTRELRKEIVDLAQRWTLMSPHTSFLVLESNDEYKRYDIDRTKRRPVWERRKVQPTKEELQRRYEDAIRAGEEQLHDYGVDAEKYFKPAMGFDLATIDARMKAAFTLKPADLFEAEREGQAAETRSKSKGKITINGPVTQPDLGTLAIMPTVPFPGFVNGPDRVDTGLFTEAGSIVNNKLYFRSYSATQEQERTRLFSLRFNEARHFAPTALTDSTSVLEGTLYARGNIVNDNFEVYESRYAWGANPSLGIPVRPDHSVTAAADAYFETSGRLNRFRSIAVDAPMPPQDAGSLATSADVTQLQSQIGALGRKLAEGPLYRPGVDDGEVAKVFAPGQTIDGADQPAISHLRRIQADKEPPRDEKLFRQRVDKLIEQTNVFYKEKKYSSAENLAQRVLVVDPGNVEAERLKQKAREARHVDDSQLPQGSLSPRQTVEEASISIISLPAAQDRIERPAPAPVTPAIRNPEPRENVTDLKAEVEELRKQIREGQNKLQSNLDEARNIQTDLTQPVDRVDATISAGYGPAAEVSTRTGRLSESELSNATSARHWAFNPESAGENFYMKAGYRLEQEADNGKAVEWDKDSRVDLFKGDVITGLEAGRGLQEDYLDALPPVLRRVEVLTPRDGTEAARELGLITLEASERPLKTVLDYLSTVSGQRIVVENPADEKRPVTFKRENITYAGYLDLIAETHGFAVDTSRRDGEKLIVLRRKAGPGGERAPADQNTVPVILTREQILVLIAGTARTPETLEQRAHLYQKAVELSSGLDRFKLLAEGLESFNHEGQHAEQFAGATARLIDFEKEVKVLEEAAPLFKDVGLRARFFARRALLSTDADRRSELYEKAFSESEEALMYLQPLAKSLLDAKKPKEAAALLERQLRKGVSAPWIWGVLSSAHTAAGDSNAALRALTQDVALRPREAVPRLVLAAEFATRGMGAEAIREARAACEFSPGSAEAHRRLLTLSKQFDDRAAREWAVLAMLRGVWRPEDQELQQRLNPRALGDVYEEAREEGKTLVAELRARGEQEKIASLKQAINEAASVDIEAVLTWDTANTDVDLHVEEPSAFQVNYNAKTSFRGGVLDRDVTNGHGPETYTLKRAAPGKYVFKVHYYGGKVPTRATVRLTRWKGMAKENVETFMIELKKEKQSEVVVELSM